MSSIVRSTRSRLCERLAYLYRHDVATALTGTVTTNGTTAVVGSGTTFTTDYAAGDLIQIAGEQPLVVDSVTNATALVLTTAATTTGGSKAHTNAQGLFEYFGGIIGSGSIDTPQTAARIQVWPVEALGEGLHLRPSLMIQAARQATIYEGFPTGVDMNAYEIVATMFVTTEPRELVAGELNTDDAFLHLRDVALNGENPSAPGKLLDPDNTARALNVFLGAIKEGQPQRFKDVTLYPLHLTYVCRENIRTGALL